MSLKYEPASVPQVGGQTSNALNVFHYPPPSVSGVDPPSGEVTGKPQTLNPEP